MSLEEDDDDGGGRSQERHVWVSGEAIGSGREDQLILTETLSAADFVTLWTVCFLHWISVVCC